MKYSKIKKQNQKQSNKVGKKKKKITKNKEVQEVLSHQDHKDAKRQKEEEKRLKLKEKVNMNIRRNIKRKSPEEDLANHGRLILDTTEATEDMMDPDIVQKFIIKEDEDFNKKMDGDLIEDTPEPVTKKPKLMENLVDEDPDSLPETPAEKFHRLSTTRSIAARSQLQARKAEALEEAQAKNREALLPIRVGGAVIPQYRAAEATPQEAVEEASEEELKATVPAPSKKGPTIISETQLKAHREKLIYEKKVFIGNGCARVLANPTERMQTLSELVGLLYEKDRAVELNVKRCAAKALLKVFLNVLPNYRLGTLQSKPGSKLKMESRNIATYEDKLLTRYEFYLKGLGQMLSRGRENKYSAIDVKLCKVALQCLCELLRRKPVFNCADDIMALVVPYVSHQETQFREVVRDALSLMFKEDMTMQFSERLVKQLTKRIRLDNNTRDGSTCIHHADAFKAILHLKVSDAPSMDAVAEERITAARDRVAVQNNLIKMRSFNNVKMTCDQKKRKRKIAVLENKLKMKNAVAEKVRVTDIQSDILEMVFALYLRALRKDCDRRTLPVVLQGLAKFGHLVDVELFTSLLSSLEDVMETQRLGAMASIHLLQTVFRLVGSLGTALVNDPQRYVDRLYRVVRSVRPSDDSIEALIPALRTVISVFIGIKHKVSSKQAIGFVKMLCSLATTLQHKHAIPVLLTVRSIMLTHRLSSRALDASSDGSALPYAPHLDHPVHCNAEAAALWELQLLQHHSHPLVRQVAQHLALGAPLLGHGALPVALTKCTVEQVYTEHCSTELEGQEAEGVLKWYSKDRKRITELLYAVPE